MFPSIDPILQVRLSPLEIGLIIALIFGLEDDILDNYNIDLCGKLEGGLNSFTSF